MSLSAERILKLCRILKGFERREDLSLSDYLRDIPRLSSLSDVASGTPVLVRGDVDCKPGPQVGDEDIRLRSMKETLEYGRSKGWKQIIFGHLGRKQPDKPIGSLTKVAKRLGEVLGCDVPLVEDCDSGLVLGVVGRPGVLVPFQCLLDVRRQGVSEAVRL